MPANQLPVDLFSIIRDYVFAFSVNSPSNKDLDSWRNFLNASKSSFHRELKRRYAYYNLNQRYSLAFIDFFNDFDGSSSPKSITHTEFSPDSDLFEDDEDYLIIKRLLGTVRYTTQQISLFVSFIGCECECPSDNNDDCFKYLLQFETGLSKIHSINLSQSMFFNDLSPLKDCSVVDLSSCSSVTDVSSLKSVQVLNLSGCTGLNCDLSALSNVVEINLSRTKISDVLP
jgi:hypothetical protein